MRVAYRFLWTLSVGLLSVTPAVAADCNELLRLGYRNILETAGSNDQRAAYSRELCSERYETASSERKARIQASYKVFSGGAEGSDVQIKTEQQRMCDFTHSASSSTSTISSVSSNIHQGALNAWQKCLELQQRSLHVEIDPTDDLRAVTVQMTWKRPNSVEFTGVDITDAGTAECTATVPNMKSGNGLIKVAANTRFAIAQDTVTFTCNRVFKRVGEAEAAKATRITFKTSEGAFNVDLPAIFLTEIETKEVRSIYNQLAELKAQSERISESLATQIAAQGETISRMHLQCNVYPQRSSSAACKEADELLMSCTSGMNRGSFNYYPTGSSPTSCDSKQAGTDWTAAICCRIAK